MMSTMKSEITYHMDIWKYDLGYYVTLDNMTPWMLSHWARSLKSVFPFLLFGAFGVNFVQNDSWFLTMSTEIRSATSRLIDYILQVRARIWRSCCGTGTCGDTCGTSTPRTTLAGSWSWPCREVNQRRSIIMMIRIKEVVLLYTCLG